MKVQLKVSSTWSFWRHILWQKDGVTPTWRLFVCWWWKFGARHSWRVFAQPCPHTNIPPKSFIEPKLVSNIFIKPDLMSNMLQLWKTNIISSSLVTQLSLLWSLMEQDHIQQPGQNSLLPSHGHLLISNPKKILCTTWGQNFGLITKFSPPHFSKSPSPLSPPDGRQVQILRHMRQSSSSLPPSSSLHCDYQMDYIYISKIMVMFPK